MNLIPSQSTPCGDYMCTWALQEKAAALLHISSDDPCRDQRDTLSDENLFGSETYFHPYDRAVRAGLILLLDDGWDVPVGSSGNDTERYFGSCDPDPEKFPHYGSTPVERLTTLVGKARGMGYAGLGVWIATETGGSGRGDLKDTKEARAYWEERAAWFHEAGLSYVKIDWGKHCDATYRAMMTEAFRKNAPEILVEHAVCQPPYSEMGDIPRRVKDTAAILPLCDVFRLYDVAPPFKLSSMLMRADEALSASVGMTPRYASQGLLNAETCSSICAALGCALGIMGGDMRDTSDAACLRWHRAAPPFSVYDTDYKKSDETLTDTFFFDRRPWWWIDVRGKRFTETAPAVMARGCELPTVEPVGAYKPYVVASKNPLTGAYSVAALRRTVDPNACFIAPAHVTFRVGGHDAPIGVFGYYASLTLVYDEPISGRVYVQDMMSDEAVDCTESCRIDGNRLSIDGDTLRLFGTSARSDEDKAEPSFVLKIL